jgi:hypothetical protein
LSGHTAARSSRATLRHGWQRPAAKPAGAPSAEGRVAVEPEREIDLSGIQTVEAEKEMFGMPNDEIVVTQREPRYPLAEGPSTLLGAPFEVLGFQSSSSRFRLLHNP